LKKKHPFILKLISFSLVIISLLGWLRVYQSIYQWNLLLKYAIYPGPWYSLISGLLIGLLGSFAVICAWVQRNWSRKYVQLIVLIIMMGWWLDYLLFSRGSISFYNLPFRIVATLVYLGLVFGYYYLKKSKGIDNEKQQ